ncbi:MAG: monovalent cation/H+ antiporter complex subunit F [bacterium]
MFQFPEFELLLKIALLILSCTMFFCLYRAILGPTTLDKLIGINVIGTKSIVAIVFIGIIFNQGYLFDIALLYALLVFIATIAFVKYLETRDIGE